MDYDQTNIPAAYDRAREHGPEALALWMDVLGSYLEGEVVETIVDLGCGTGRFCASLATRFDADVVGVDPSAKMLAQAREKRLADRVRLVRGRAEEIPVASRAVDAVFMSMCFHHFVDPARAIEECRRVLREGGTAFVRNCTRDVAARLPGVDLFPSLLSLLEDVLPSRAELRDGFGAASFRMIASQVVTQTLAPDWRAYADKLAAGGDSVLARLDPQELERGLDAMRHARDDAEDPTIREPVDLLVFRCL